MIEQKEFTIQTRGRSSIEITDSVDNIVGHSGITTGLCNIFIQHTSASIVLCENADPVVRDDLERFMSQLVPDGDPLFRHTAEGADDMPAHIRTILMETSITLPVKDNRCHLGTWQGIYLYEHRTSNHKRKIILTVFGE